MAMDEKAFAVFRLHEIIFPSIIQQRVISLLSRVDRALGSPVNRTIQYLESQMASPADYIRRTRLQEPEEDDLLLFHKFASSSLLMFFPQAEILAPLIRYDELPEFLRHELDQFYLDCVKRRMFLAGENRRLLSKNTAFTTKVRSLVRTFPDPKFIYLIRNPAVSISSMQDMFERVWNIQMNPEQCAEHAKRLFKTACYLYSHALKELSCLPSSSWCVVHYENLIADPEQAVKNAYEALGLAMSQDYEEKLKTATARARSFKSRHSYSLSQMGVTEEEVRTALPEVYERFSFEESARLN
jgi:hypothetical protein